MKELTSSATGSVSAFAITVAVCSGEPAPPASLKPTTACPYSLNASAGASASTLTGAPEIVLGLTWRMFPLLVPESRRAHICATPSMFGSCQTTRPSPSSLTPTTGALLALGLRMLTWPSSPFIAPSEDHVIPLKRATRTSTSSSPGRIGWIGSCVPDASGLVSTR